MYTKADKRTEPYTVDLGVVVLPQANQLGRIPLCPPLTHLLDMPDGHLAVGDAAGRVYGASEMFRQYCTKTAVSVKTRRVVFPEWHSVGVEQYCVETQRYELCGYAIYAGYNEHIGVWVVLEPDLARHETDI